MIWQWHDLAKTTAWDHRAGTVHVGPSPVDLVQVGFHGSRFSTRALCLCLLCALNSQQQRLHFWMKKCGPQFPFHSSENACCFAWCLVVSIKLSKYTLCTFPFFLIIIIL